jgi:16S rRNA (adenine1518-N6/adenine1519-N6)-dimethyltransferase
VLGTSEVRALLDRHGLSARRSLGQNFVADPNTVRRIVRLAGVEAGDRVVEVGPGLGSLTLALADAGAHVLAVEKDTDLVPVLEEVLGGAAASGPVTVGGGRVRVVTADALTLDWPGLLATGPDGTGDGTGDGPGTARWTLVANLPYNVAVPVVMGVLQRAAAVDRLVVMVQKEVADRLVATPGGRTIGIPTIKVAWYGGAKVLATVPPEVFVPRPRVMSAVVGIDRRPPPSTEVGPSDVFPLVERAYHQRRKMLRSTLGAVVPAGAFDRAGIGPTARPEELGVLEWARLAGAVQELAGERS